MHHTLFRVLVNLMAPKRDNHQRLDTSGAKRGAGQSAACH
jgi:hypothetical protein